MLRLHSTETARRQNYQSSHRVSAPSHQRRQQAIVQAPPQSSTSSTYQNALRMGAIDQLQHKKIEDIKLAMQSRQEDGTPLPLFVKRRPEDGKTELYLQLDEADDLPEAITKKYCTEDNWTNGIHLTLPEKALPATNRVLPDNVRLKNKELLKIWTKDSLKTWLGISNKMESFTNWLGLTKEAEDAPNFELHYPKEDL